MKHRDNLPAPQKTGRLVVSADDFGLSKEVNEGIIGAYVKGSIDSASLMPNGAAFDHAIKLLRQHAQLDVGLHLTLVGEKPILSPKTVPSLVSRKGFYPNWACFLKAYALGRINKKEIDREIGAQFDRVIHRGVSISHVDSHQHIHMFPGVLEMVMQHAKKYGVTKIRCPYTPWAVSKMLLRRNLSRWLGGFFLNNLCRFQQRLLRKNGFMGTEYYWNVSNIGVHFKRAVEEFIATSPGGSWELSFHPAIFEDNLSRKYHPWRYHWEQEYHYLVHDEFQRCLNKTRIQRHSFRNLN